MCWSSVDLGHVDVVQLLDGGLDLVPVGLDVTDEDERVVITVDAQFKMADVQNLETRKNARDDIHKNILHKYLCHTKI